MNPHQDALVTEIQANAAMGVDSKRGITVSSKFKNVPVDAETRIVQQREILVETYPALYQKWFWDGITAESLIFANEDIDCEDIGKIELAVRAFSGVMAESEVTIKRSNEGFTFFNFNFQDD